MRMRAEFRLIAHATTLSFAAWFVGRLIFYWVTRNDANMAYEFRKFLTTAQLHGGSLDYGWDLTLVLAGFLLLLPSSEVSNRRRLTLCVTSVLCAFVLAIGSAVYPIAVLSGRIPAVDGLRYFGHSLVVGCCVFGLLMAAVFGLRDRGLVARNR